MKQKKNIFPTPQFFRRRKGALLADRYYLQTELKIDDVNRAVIQEMLPLVDRAATGTKILRIVRLLSPDKKLQQSGAYSLRINSRGITAGIYDQRSLYYALKTLRQLLDRQNENVLIPLVAIDDFPDVPIRGTVEGFYGVPWSFEDRIRQFNFYGDVKMNTYIYGPKDDPYHSSPQWRDPYPNDKAKQIARLAEEAKHNYVDFVWAVHPGKDIQWNEGDRVALLKKFERMYDLGIRSFAVFFDDIVGEGTNPRKQAELLNYLHEQFIQKYPDVKPLIMCPTEYNKSWANPEQGTYLDILGQELNPGVRVLWTGRRVISDIDKQTTEWANRRLKRKIFFWWNFPVNDYVRDHILMGPAYGNSKDMCEDISGFVCNPMEKAEASGIGIFGVASYAWNMKRYDPKKSFQQATRYIVPDVPDCLALFAENNSDLGPNGHGYRREESGTIQPLVSKLKATLITDPDKTLLDQVREYCHEVAQAPQRIIRNATNQNLVSEIRPWLDQFALLGQAGKTILSALANYDNNPYDTNWDNYLKVRNILLEIDYIDKTQNQNPYQPGVKTGSLVLMPFVRYAFDLLGNKLFGNPLTQRIGKKTRAHIITNIIQLEAQNVQVSEESVSVSPCLEPIVLEPGTYIGLRWPENRSATLLHYNFNIREIGKWGAFEVSPNGKDWVLYNIELKEQSGDLPLKPYLNFVRFINNSDTTHRIYLNEFTVKTKLSNARRDISVVRDRNPQTYMIIPAGSHVTLTVKTSGTIELFMELFHQEIRINNQCNDNIYSGNDNYLKMSAEKLNGCTEIKITNIGKRPVHFFEVMT